MWWIQLKSNNKLILIKNGSPVLNEFSLSFIVAVRALHDGTGRKIQVSFDDGSSLQLSLDDFIPKSTSLKADMKASDFAKQFAKEFAGQLREASETNSQLPEKTKSRFKIKKKHIFAACFGGVLAVVAAPVVLTAVGFTSVGVAAGSFAAGMMSTAAIANGGGIAAGSAVAVLQSVGAAGLGAAGTAAVGGAGAAVGAGASGLVDAVGDKISSKK